LTSALHLGDYEGTHALGPVSLHTKPSQQGGPLLSLHFSFKGMHDSVGDCVVGDCVGIKVIEGDIEG